MFIDRMLNQSSAPLLEQMAPVHRGAAQADRRGRREHQHAGYRQKDLSLEKFQQMLRERVEQRATRRARATSISTTSQPKSRSPTTACCSTTGTTGRWNN